MLITHGIEVWSGIGGMRRYAMRRVNRILCVSHYTRRRILEQAPALNADRLIIFPNALADTWARVAPAPSSRPLPARFILSVTRLEPGDRYKGIATVIEAFSMLADESMHYYVVGHGNDLAFLQLVAERCCVRERVHFVRGVSDSELIALYQQCDAFVLPSGKEGFGIVFLEAMFFGAPVIAAREKGAMDVVRDGETGISVHFGDVIAVRQAIEALLGDGALRERLRANGRSLVTEGGPFTFACFTRRCAEAFEFG
jgi:glycosyltransferase involved in cell wall biosynthesis